MPESNEDLATEAAKHAIRYGMHIAIAYATLEKLLNHHEGVCEDENYDAAIGEVEHNLSLAKAEHGKMHAALFQVSGWLRGKK